MEHARQFYIDGAWVDPAAPKLLDVAGLHEFGAWGARRVARDQAGRRLQVGVGRA